MVSPLPHLKPLNSLHIFSMKSSSSSPSSTLSSMKIKTLIHTLVFSHVCRLARALSKAKSILIEVLRDIQYFIHFTYPLNKNNNIKKKKKSKKIFGSFRLHYNWCSSSHVLPMPTSHLYYDSTWNSIVSTHYEQREMGIDGAEPESQLSGYLHWLEEKKSHDTSISTSESADSNEIDKLADMFIASCHEKFRLEKQESYRRFQEMMARSM